MSSFENYDRYAFVFAHPDDEIYTVNIIRNLVVMQKSLQLIYLTNGDYAGNEVGVQRQKELASSMALLGVSPGQVTQVGLSERPFFEHADEAIELVQKETTRVKPDCVVSHDYEGGHNAHDLTSFSAYLSAQAVHTDFWVFPAYHGQPNVRVWNQFIQGRSETYSRTLQSDEQALKRAIMQVHASQKDFFDRVMRSRSAGLFMSREVLRLANNIDYRSKPTTPVGYEIDDKTERFDVLQAIIRRYV